MITYLSWERKGVAVCWDEFHTTFDKVELLTIILYWNDWIFFLHGNISEGLVAILYITSKASVVKKLTRNVQGESN